MGPTPNLRRIIRAILVPALFASFLAVGDSAAAPASRTINVDCDKGQSIQDALSRDAGELTINISGFCRENVIIRRSNVHLVGTNPNVDGIEGFREGPEFSVSAINGALTIDGVQNVQADNLGITGDPRAGVIVRNAFAEIRIENMRVTNDGDFGIFTNDVDLIVRDSEIIGDFATALRVDEGGGRVVCRECTIDATSPDGDGIIALVEESGNLELTASDLAGSGLLASDHADLIVEDSSVSASAATGFLIVNHSSLTLADTEFDTGLRVEEKSKILLRGATQLSTASNFIMPGFNREVQR